MRTGFFGNRIRHMAAVVTTLGTALGTALVRGLLAVRIGTRLR